LQFARPTGQVAAWEFGPDPRAFVAPAPVLFDHGDLLVDAAIAGLGITQVFDFMVEGPIRRGEVQEILADRSVAGPPIHALCLPGRQRVPRIRAFLDFASEALSA
jgi:DNA-binding transcriptional LysR family regulator